jgi:hypothetical protein
LGKIKINFPYLDLLTVIIQEDRTPMQPIDYLLMEGNHMEDAGKQFDKNDMERRSTKVSVSSFLNDNLIQVPSTTCQNSIKRKSITYDSPINEDETLSEYLKFRAKTRKTNLSDDTPREILIEKSKNNLREPERGLQYIAVTDFQQNENKRIVKNKIQINQLK